MARLSRGLVPRGCTSRAARAAAARADSCRSRRPGTALMSAVIVFELAALAPALRTNAWLSIFPTGSRAWDRGQKPRRASARRRRSCSDPHGTAVSRPPRGVRGSPRAATPLSVPPTVPGVGQVAPDRARRLAIGVDPVEQRLDVQTLGWGELGAEEHRVVLTAPGLERGLTPVGAGELILDDDVGEVGLEMFGVNVVIADTPAKSPLANWASLYCASVSNGCAARPGHRLDRDEAAGDCPYPSAGTPCRST